MAVRKGPGIAAKPPVPNKNKNQKKNQNKGNSYSGLNNDQSKIINQTNQADLQLGQTAQGQMQGIENSYSQPFDYSKLPQSPWAQGQTIQDMEGQYYDRALSNYERSMQKQYAQEDEAFRHRMANEGVPEGSEKYKNLQRDMQEYRANAKQNAMDSAYFNAGANASNWNNISSQNFQNAYGFQQDQRAQPLSDYSRIMAAQSGMPLQNLGYAQSRGLQEQQGQIARSMPRGGSGGGTPPLYAQYGFSSPLEYDAFKTQQARDQAQWEWSNSPQFKQQKGTSPWASALGQLGGIAAGSYLGQVKW